MEADQKEATVSTTVYHLPAGKRDSSLNLNGEVTIQIVCTPSAFVVDRLTLNIYKTGVCTKHTVHSSVVVSVQNRADCSDCVGVS